MMRIIIAIAIFNICNGCTLPEGHAMNLFSIERGKETSTYIKETSLQSPNNFLDGTCFLVRESETKYPNALEDYEVIFKNRTNNCYFCYRFLRRSALVMQYQHSECISSQDKACNTVKGETFVTGFLQSREKISFFNCKSIIEGVYQFNYKFTRFSGVCDRTKNIVKACQKQGSPLRDNSVFTMNFAFCNSINPAESKGNIRNIPFKFTWRCYGRWVEKDKSVWGAIVFDNYEEKFKYRCITTRIDQQDSTKQTWGLSGDANCNSLGTLDQVPIRLELKPAFDPDIKLEEVEPGCKLPTNFTGDWFYPSEYNTMVRINSTHIYYKRKTNQDQFEEIYFVCRQYQESRYLMATITKGKCYLDYTCFHFLPRHHNIIRFRMGRPFRMNSNNRMTLSDLMMRTFREACHWNSFTLNYVQWVYEYYILDPPEPINCPIQGRYKFAQEGQEQEKYYTKIPGGMTPRPRLQVLCDRKLQTDLATCYENPKIMNLDVKRCMRLDFTGRPISEYDISDNRLTCVGYWMEDTKSFLITYDPEDAVTHNFRCWVYKRIDLNSYLMSRSHGTRCSKSQTAESSGPSDGASLRLEMTQNELEFDACPMQFDDGSDPYSQATVLNVFSAAPSISKYSLSVVLPITLSISVLVNFYF